MAFIHNAEAIARSAMAEINPALAEKYASLIKLLSMNPGAATASRKKNSPTPGTEEYIRGQALNFASARSPRAPEPPATIPDPMVSVILKDYFQVPAANLERAKREHQLSMGAENLVGDLLERYLASIMEPRGWIWCSGSTVKAVDFIKPPATAGGTWKLLQIKNRNNSENSSSAAIRNGTEIEKWFRTFSMKSGSNWSAFPDDEIRPLVCEEGFQQYVQAYLDGLKGRLSTPVKDALCVPVPDSLSSTL